MLSKRIDTESLNNSNSKISIKMCIQLSNISNKAMCRCLDCETSRFYFDKLQLIWKKINEASLDTFYLADFGKTQDHASPAYFMITKPLGLCCIFLFWGMSSTPSLPLPPGSLWTKVIVPVWVPSKGQIVKCNHFLNLKPFNYVQTNVLWLILKCYLQTIHLQIIYISNIL